MLKYGRRQPKRALSIKFADILKVVPNHPISEDYLGNLSGWKMLGNDSYGDCVAVAWANSRRFISALLGTENYPTQDQVFQLYKTQNSGFPNDDNGMEIQTMLEYLNTSGGPDGTKLVAFASVDVNNLDEVKAALYIFGGILLGIEVQNANIDDFNAGKIWDYHPGQPIEGGHGVLAGGYAGQVVNDIRFITWADETGMTDAFWQNLVDNPNGEAWVLIWPENLGTKQFVDGIDMNTLASDYQAITGKTLPVPPGPIPPAPVPPAPINTCCLSKLFSRSKK
jgi:hypothetical protein